MPTWIISIATSLLGSEQGLSFLFGVLEKVFIEKPALRKSAVDFWVRLEKKIPEASEYRRQYEEINRRGQSL